MATVSTSTESTVPQSKTAQPLTHEELMGALRKQIEYYFSQENLMKDSYLLSLMNDSGYVPLTTIAGFRKVKDLSTNMDDILEALRSSQSVIVDEANLLIKPAFVFERKTIILRDVPADTTEEEVRALFNDLATVESVKAEFGNTWFVVVDSEKSAVSAVEALRHSTLHGAAVKARVKNESYLKNLMKMLNTNADGIPSEFVVPAGTQPMMFMPYPGQPMMMAFPQGSMFTQSMMANAIVEPKNARKGRNNRKGNHHDRHPRTIVQPTVVPQLHSPDVFPPLVSTSVPKPAPIDVKYSKDEICEIVKGLKDLSCPPIASEGVNEVIVETANQELVSKGRTFSIDQAIQQGVPRSMSVDSVDYTNMIQGDLDEALQEKVRKARRQHKHQPKLNYRSILKNSTPLPEATSAPAAAPAAPVAPAQETKAPAKKETKPVAKKPIEKRGKKNEGKVQEKKSKPKTEDDGWKTIEKKH